MKILIVENEPLQAAQLQSFVRKAMPKAIFLPVAASIRETVQLLNAQEPDLIFMDIELADGNAFSIFKQIEVRSPVIFTTAFNQYFASAFENNGVDYLVKPVSQDRVTSALHHSVRLKPKHSVQELPVILEKIVEKQPRSYRSYFLVRQGQKYIPIRTADINHFYSENTLVYLVTTDKRKFVMAEALSDLEYMLNPTDFFRMNRKYLLSKKSIHSLDAHTRGQVAVNANLLENERIIVSREQTPLLKEWLIQ